MRITGLFSSRKVLGKHKNIDTEYHGLRTIRRIENMFISYLYNNRDEQGEGITYFYRLRSVYLKFFGMPDQGSSDDRGVMNTDHSAIAGGLMHSSSVLLLT